MKSLLILGAGTAGTALANRLRRRLGMGVTGKTFLTVAAVFAVTVLALWAYTTK